MVSDKNFRDFLDAISVCFIAHDFGMWQARVIYPFSLITAEGPVLMQDDAELRANFELYLVACEVMKLDDIYRRPISLENCGDDSWIGTYETELLSHGVRATAPYISSALLQETPGGVKMTSILNARGHHDWTGQRPHRTV